MRPNDNLNLKKTCLAAAMALSCAGRPATAALVTFTIDTAQSSVVLSGSLTVPRVGTFSYETQGTGSLTTSYGGTVALELKPPNISFPGGSDIRLETNGVWQPSAAGEAGSQPADYAGRITPPETTNYFAGRNIQFDVAGAATLLSDGSFNPTNIVISYLTNSVPAPAIDFRVTSEVPGDSTNGSVSLVGSSTNTTTGATLSSGSGLLTLVLPVHATNSLTFGSYPSTTILDGQIVATAPASAWPLFVTISLAGTKLNLSWPALLGQSFSVQATGALGEPWGGASGTTKLAGGTATWTTVTTTNAAQFYRVVLSQ
jgi:hypothetical protein